MRQILHHTIRVCVIVAAGVRVIVNSAMLVAVFVMVTVEELHAVFRGELGSRGDFCRHKLADACPYHDIKPGGHRALSDVIASIELPKVMASHLM